jgi:hypothetical protein
MSRISGNPGKSRKRLGLSTVARGFYAFSELIQSEIIIDGRDTAST